MTEIELHAVEVFGYHGATEVEEREGQTFLFDIVLRLRREPAGDELADTIDYREVAACVREISAERRVRLLETLAASVADELMRRFTLDRVRVRVRKPHVQLDPHAAYTAAVVERP